MKIMRLLYGSLFSAFGGEDLLHPVAIRAPSTQPGSSNHMKEVVSNFLLLFWVSPSDLLLIGS